VRVGEAFERWTYRRNKALPPDPIGVVLSEIIAYRVGDEGRSTPGGLRHIKARAAFVGNTTDLIFAAGPQRGRPFVWGDLAGVLGARAVSAHEIDLLVLEIQSGAESKRLAGRGITLRVRMAAAEIPDFLSGLDWQVRKRLLDWPEPYRDFFTTKRAKVATLDSLWT
jgi:hypothetical protein